MMSRRRSSQREWEEQIVGDYYDYRLKQVLEPLYHDMQRWKAGELSHAEIVQAIHRTHKQTQELYGRFSAKREWLARTIQMDRDWFEAWVQDHPAPDSASLIPSGLHDRD
jgi:hypothetical protein